MHHTLPTHMVVADVEHRDLGDGLSKSARAEPIAVVVEEEAVEREHHVGSESRGHLDLLVLLIDPFDEFRLLGKRVAVDLSRRGSAKEMRTSSESSAHLISSAMETKSVISSSGWNACSPSNKHVNRLLRMLAKYVAPKRIRSAKREERSARQSRRLNRVPAHPLNAAVSTPPEKPLHECPTPAKSQSQLEDVSDRGSRPC